MKGMRLGTGRLVLFALLGAILVGLQVAMAALPNVEAVSLLVMVYTVVFGGAVAYILCVFVVLEMLIWGAGTWVISYLYVWAVLAVLAWSLRKMDSRLGWAILSGSFGLAFGALCALSICLWEGSGCSPSPGWQGFPSTCCTVSAILSSPFSCLRPVGGFWSGFGNKRLSEVRLRAGRDAVQSGGPRDIPRPPLFPQPLASYLFCTKSHLMRLNQAST